MIRRLNWLLGQVFGYHVCVEFTKWKRWGYTYQVRECLECGRKFSRDI